MSEYCDGCARLRYDPAVNRYDVNRALCCRADMPLHGTRRVVAVSGVGRPIRIPRPKWCEGRA